MKTIHKLILPLILIGCLLFTACKDDDNDNLMTAKQNAEKIENYGVTTAYFHSSTLATATQEKSGYSGSNFPMSFSTMMQETQSVYL